MFDLIGWTATAIFALSYFCKRPVTMRSVQALAALVWLIYGILIGSNPIIVANIIVASLASYSAWRQSSHGTTDANPNAPECK